MSTTTTSTAPKRLLVFGASGHIGGPLAQVVCNLAPGTTLRLATSSQAKVAQLEQRYPEAEVVVADYLDPASLTAALTAIEGVFVVTPDLLDEERAMSNLAQAAGATGSVRRVVRIVGVPPAVGVDEPPKEIDDPGPAIGHVRAVQTLRAGGMPVTVLNSAGYFMDNFTTFFAPMLRSRRRLVVPFERRMCFTDPAELGEAAAALLVTETVDRQLGGTCHFNSGEAPIRFADVAALLSKVMGVEIVHDPDPSTFIERVGPILAQVTGDDRAAHRLLTDFSAELEHQASFVGSPLGEALLGRQPTTLREWLEAHRDELRGDRPAGGRT